MFIHFCCVLLGWKLFCVLKLKLCWELDGEAYIEMLDDDIMYPSYEEGDDEILDVMYMYDDEFYDRGVEMDG